MEILGIDVGASMVRRWVTWLAPVRQPFFLTVGEISDLGLSPQRPAHELPAELDDTYQVWNLPEGLETVWLEEQQFHARPQSVRAGLVGAQARHGRGAVPAVSDWADTIDVQLLREQADGLRFVWWPTLVEPRAEAILQRFVSDGHLPCLRRLVPDDVWQAAASTLPYAEALSGTFADVGGANCFGTVMAASGVRGAADTCMPREPFEAWLETHCVTGGSDDLPGTVLVWRSSDGACQHAAVTLGNGWALHKPGQEWISPRQVLTVHDLIHLAPPGVTLHRYSLQNAHGLEAQMEPN